MSTRSTSRLEYPHSLSYQPRTFATFPLVIVSEASNVHDAGEPTMSEDQRQMLLAGWERAVHTARGHG
jgi:hypothetical protein